MFYAGLMLIFGAIFIMLEDGKPNNHELSDETVYTPQKVTYIYNSFSNCTISNNSLNYKLPQKEYTTYKIED